LISDRRGEKYDDEAEAIERAEEVATCGHTVEVTEAASAAVTCQSLS
jgi:hypothetical protein